MYQCEYKVFYVWVLKGQQGVRVRTDVLCGYCKQCYLLLCGQCVVCGGEKKRLRVWAKKFPFTRAVREMIFVSIKAIITVHITNATNRLPLHESG